MRGSLTVAVGVSDRSQVTADTQHLTCDIHHLFLLLILFKLLMLLITHIERFSVFRIPEFLQSSKNVLHKLMCH